MAKSRRAKNQIKESDPKMGFVGRPNKALANLEFKRPIWSQIGRRTGWEKERRREEKRKRKRRSSQDQGQKGMDAWILVWNYLDF